MTESSDHPSEADASATGAESPIERLENPAEIQGLLQAMQEPGTTEVLWDDESDTPTTVLEVQQAASLTLDMTLADSHLPSLQPGLTLRLRGQVRGKLVTSPPLEVMSCDEENGQWRCRLAWPAFLEVLHRRDTYRAELRLGMQVGVLVEPLRDNLAHLQIQADLRDLSVEGCRLELPISASHLLGEGAPRFGLTLCFANGARFQIDAEARHVQPEPQRHLVTAGLQFPRRTPEQERQLWYYVREIERESARYFNQGTALSASSLFRKKPGVDLIGRRQGNTYPTPMARRLSEVAGYLDAQWVALQQGEPLDLVALSQHSEALVEMLAEDRESLLFALVCMRLESTHVQHGLAVATRLLDLIGEANMPSALRKAVVAVALVHDLGKALLRPELLQSPTLSDEQYRQMQRHAPLLIAQLEGCDWLPRSVVRDIVEGSNERLDGSGYPRGLRDNQLHQLARLAMIVDVADAMGRGRADRPAWTIGGIHRYLLGRPRQFDPHWVKRYILHFGRMPVGTLVRFADDTLGWVARLDRQGNLSQVYLATEPARPDQRLGRLLHDGALLAKGEPVEALPLPD